MIANREKLRVWNRMTAPELQMFMRLFGADEIPSNIQDRRRRLADANAYQDKTAIAFNLRAIIRDMMDANMAKYPDKAAAFREPQEHRSNSKAP